MIYPSRAGVIQYTSFNEAALEDASVQGLPQSILLKVYSQPSLPYGYDNWKAVMCNLDCLQRGMLN